MCWAIKKIIKNFEINFKIFELKKIKDRADIIMIDNGHANIISKLGGGKKLTIRLKSFKLYPIWY